MTQTGRNMHSIFYFTMNFQNSDGALTCQKKLYIMLRKERHNYIIQKIRLDNKVISTDLSRELHVSEDTIRRDLRELSYQGAILKVHGGAVTTSQHLYEYQKENIVDYDAKSLIAKKAVPLIKDNSVVIMSGGTTNLALARILPPELKATIYTYSLPIALQLTEHPNIELIFIGGKILKSAQVTTGMDVIQAVGKIRADYCFLGVSGLETDAGLTEIDWEVAQIKKRMIEISQKCVLLLTSNKLGTVQRFLIEKSENLHVIATELPPHSRKIKSFAKKGIQIL